MVNAGEKSNAARVPEFEGRQGVLGQEDLFYRDRIRCVLRNDLGQLPVDDVQAVTQGALATRRDDPVVDVYQAVSAFFDDAPAGGPASRVDPEDAHQIKSRFRQVVLCNKDSNYCRGECGYPSAYAMTFSSS